MNIFFGCGITDVPPEKKVLYTSTIRDLQGRIKKAPSIDLVFGNLYSPAPPNTNSSRKLYTWYHSKISLSDLFIGDVSFPSLGLGIELHIASSIGIPTILIFNEAFQRPESISRMARGLPKITELLGYQNTSSAYQQLEMHLQALAPKH